MLCVLCACVFPLLLFLSCVRAVVFLDVLFVVGLVCVMVSCVCVVACLFLVFVCFFLLIQLHSAPTWENDFFVFSSAYYVICVCDCFMFF